jgi:hypothetical protein
MSSIIQMLGTHLVSTSPLMAVSLPQEPAAINKVWQFGTAVMVPEGILLN